MQYFIKIFNATTKEFVGYYKETGIGCVTRLPNGTKYFNDFESAYEVMLSLEDGFLREKDGHYYPGSAVIYGDASREPKKSIYRDAEYKEEELKAEREAFIRQSRFRYRC